LKNSIYILLCCLSIRQGGK